MKKTLKFVCSSVLTLCLAAGVLAGCGEKTNDSEENSEFTWSGMTDATVVAALKSQMRRERIFHRRSRYSLLTKTKPN